jgi:L,D-peptidoglycan transpeptidase YkuD (ErfK/YbiS/YcfS/YnhG family)
MPGPSIHRPRSKRPPCTRRRPRTIVVSGLSRAAPRGMANADNLGFPCALGKGGRTSRKREGDGATPVGRWHLMTVFYRPDRVRRPSTGLPVRPISRHDGWCDAPGDRNYNRPVRLPYGASAERMWRADHLYDIVVVLSHNTRPRVRGAGSAIFMHVAERGYAPTAGCIAFRREHLLRLLKRLGRGACIRIKP